MKVLLKIVLFIMPVVNCAFSYANQYESLQVIQERVHQFIEDEVKKNNPSADLKIRVQSIDSRLKLKKCAPSKLEVATPYHRDIERTSSVHIKCGGPVNWSFYIPFDIQLFKKIVVANTNIGRGHKISADDVKVIKVDMTRLSRSYFVDPKEVIGKILTRGILKNGIINPNSVKLAKLIKKGDVITLSAVTSSIRVTVKGVALESGSLGERIAVKNLSTNKVIEAKVIGGKDVLINL